MPPSDDPRSGAASAKATIPRGAEPGDRRCAPIRRRARRVDRLRSICSDDQRIHRSCPLATPPLFVTKNRRDVPARRRASRMRVSGRCVESHRTACPLVSMVQHHYAPCAFGGQRNAAPRVLEQSARECVLVLVQAHRHHLEHRRTRLGHAGREARPPRVPTELCRIQTGLSRAPSRSRRQRCRTARKPLQRRHGAPDLTEQETLTDAGANSQVCADARQF